MPIGIYERKSATERFWANVDKSGDCWEWMASKNTYGYGCLRFEGKQGQAHRFSWFLHHGEIPKGMLVCHTCDNPGCVNPAHLFLGTPKDNTLDAVKKGRMGAGEANGRAKLSNDDVLSIREDDRTSRVIGLDYGVQASAIRKIKRRESWRHL